jgi:hypothetical protein
MISLLERDVGVGEGQIQLVKNFFTGNDHLRQSFFRGFECAKSWLK